MFNSIRTWPHSTTSVRALTTSGVIIKYGDWCDNGIPIAATAQLGCKNPPNMAGHIKHRSYKTPMRQYLPVIGDPWCVHMHTAHSHPTPNTSWLEKSNLNTERRIFWNIWDVCDLAVSSEGFQQLLDIIQRKLLCEIFKDYNIFFLVLELKKSLHLCGT